MSPPGCPDGEDRRAPHEGTPETRSEEHDRQFTAMFAESDDPWGFRTRWYEARKRDLVLACLPERRYRSAFEPGCANGELAAALATRCDALLASDGNAAAVALARQRLASFGHVRLMQAWMPQDWPAMQFDLIVLGELGYYLDEDALTRLTVRARESLTAQGTLLACHWRHPIGGCSIDGNMVHRILAAGLTMSRIAQHVERDFLIDVWSRDDTSVAAREGLV